jgi:hypothetical protein
MTLSTAINASANAVLAVSALHLVFRVFGHPESAIWRRPWAAVLCKAATTVTVCGALWNVLTLSTPAPSETCLNIGVSLNFIWISYYLRNDSPTRTKHSGASGKISGRNATRGAANPRARKKSPPARGQ